MKSHSFWLMADEDGCLYGGPQSTAERAQQAGAEEMGPLYEEDIEREHAIAALRPVRITIEGESWDEVARGYVGLTEIENLDRVARLVVEFAEDEDRGAHAYLNGNCQVADCLAVEGTESASLACPATRADLDATTPASRETP